MKEYDPDGSYIFYYGPLPYQDLNQIYTKADLGLFASSCETFGQIITEAMSAGLPLSCSKLSAMPEVLGNAGVYFHPEKPGEIANAIQSLLENPIMREKKAEDGFIRSKNYSWDRAGTDTFDFLAKVGQLYYKNRGKKYPVD
jgi:glycosyltransferase involved in cell wall biosynthesis